MPPHHRRGSGIDYGLLDETSESDERDYTVTHNAANFAVILEAVNRATRREETSPGPSTPEAPPMQPSPPADMQQLRDFSDDEAGDPSPPHTRNGCIRGSNRTTEEIVLPPDPPPAHTPD